MLLGRTPSDGAKRKGYRAGTHRLVSPAETYARWGPLMPQMGVTRLANVTGLDYIGIPVFVGVRPNAKTLAVTQGKGLSDDAARVSAMMEAIEQWHAENVDLPLRLESPRSLSRSHPILDLAAIETQSGRVVDRDVSMLWVEGYDLLRECPTWVPLECVSLDILHAPRLPQDTNGLASGNDLVEATVHGLCELIERDAATLWFAGAGGEKETQVDLDSIEDTHCRALLERIERAGLLVGLYDNTSDVGVPSYQCILFDRPGTHRSMGYFWGFGCHLAPEVAAARAISEAVQCRLTEITGTRDDIPDEAYAENRSDEELVEMRDVLLNPPPTRRFGDRASLATDSVDDDLRVVLEALRAAKIERAVVVDLSKESLRIPVVKTLAPELEGFPLEHEPGARARALGGGG